MLSGREVQRIRKSKNLSQQDLAFRSRVNKAYISEYESGVRPELPPHMMRALEDTLLERAPAGFTRPSLVTRAGRRRLRLTDPDGNEYFPKIASLQWTEDDGTTYSIFLGDS
jgi:transcriptional regulator with XRE-family HTH domain